ncbi:MAG: hypothetical protein SGILL_010470 [Bacillariaceae sp.]
MDAVGDGSATTKMDAVGKGSAVAAGEEAKKGMTEAFLKALAKYRHDNPTKKDGYVQDGQVKVRLKQLDQYTFKNDEYFNVQFKGCPVIAIGEKGDGILIIILCEFLVALALGTKGRSNPLQHTGVLKKKCVQHMNKKVYLCRDGKRVPDSIYPTALRKAQKEFECMENERRAQYLLQEKQQGNQGLVNEDEATGLGDEDEEESIHEDLSPYLEDLEPNQVPAKSLPLMEELLPHRIVLEQIFGGPRLAYWRHGEGTVGQYNVIRDTVAMIHSFHGLESVIRSKDNKAWIPCTKQQSWENVRSYLKEANPYDNIKVQPIPPTSVEAELMDGEAFGLETTSPTSADNDIVHSNAAVVSPTNAENDTEGDDFVVVESNIDGDGGIVIRAVVIKGEDVERHAAIRMIERYVTLKEVNEVLQHGNRIPDTDPSHEGKFRVSYGDVDVVVRELSGKLVTVIRHYRDETKLGGMPMRSLFDRFDFDSMSEERKWEVYIEEYLYKLGLHGCFSELLKEFGRLQKSRDRKDSMLDRFMKENDELKDEVKVLNSALEEAQHGGRTVANAGTASRAGPSAGTCAGSKCGNKASSGCSLKRCGKCCSCTAHKKKK